MATLKDVAALAGVSSATASLALNGGPVRASTRETVRKAAVELSYVPNKVGQMLMTGRSNTIEMIIMTADEYPNIVRRTSLFYYLMEGVLSVANRRNVAVRFAVKSHDDPSLGAYFAELVGSRTVDGAIILPQFTRGTGFLAPLDRADFPYVLLRPASFGTELSFVDMGNLAGGRLIAELFIKLGAQRLAIINGPHTHFDAIEREQGFTAALFDGGASLVARADGDYTIESGVAGMQHIARHKLPDAVFCANDYMAAGAIKYLHSAGVRVPQDIAVIGYDNADIASALDPALTTVDNRFFDLGSNLADGLMSVLDGNAATIAETLMPRLVLRTSHGSVA